MFNLYSETFSWSRACVVVIKPLVLLMVKSDAKLPMIDVRDKRYITHIYSFYEERRLRYKRTPKPTMVQSFMVNRIEVNKGSKLKENGINQKP